MTVKLEVGKKYLTNDNTIVDCEYECKKDHHHSYCFFWKDYLVEYDENGRCLANADENMNIKCEYTSKMEEFEKEFKGKKIRLGAWPSDCYIYFLEWKDISLFKGRYEDSGQSTFGGIYKWKEYKEPEKKSRCITTAEAIDGRWVFCTSKESLKAGNFFNAFSFYGSEIVKLYESGGRMSQKATAPWSEWLPMDIDLDEYYNKLTSEVVNEMTGFDKDYVIVKKGCDDDEQ